MTEQHKIWPTSSQKELLRATFLTGDEGISAFERWKSQIDMADHPDPGSFRLLSFLFHQLKAQGIDDPIMMRLKGIARRNWYKNQQFFRSLVPPLQALHEAGIECILLGGPAIALNYHTEYALGSDIKLAIGVQVKQVRQTIKQLQALGWQPEKRLTDTVIEPYLAVNWMHIFQDAIGRRIQLQWHLLPTCRTVEAEVDFWSETMETNIYDVPVRILSPADQLLHSCVEDHSSSELSNFLRAIDVMLIIKATPNLEWDRLLSQAEKYRLVVSLLAVLGYIQDTLDEPLSPAVWQRLWSLPISRQERLEHWLKTSHLTLWRRFWQIWFGYRRHTASASQPQNLFGFPRYLQHFWCLPTLRQVPGQVTSIVRQHLRGRFLCRHQAGR